MRFSMLIWQVIDQVIDLSSLVLLLRAYPHLSYYSNKSLTFAKLPA